jgi:hypothetical protein
MTVGVKVSGRGFMTQENYDNRGIVFSRPRLDPKSAECKSEVLPFDNTVISAFL